MPNSVPLATSFSWPLVTSTDIDELNAPGSARDQVMQKMGDLVNAYAPWNVTVFRYENVLVHPWVVGYKYNEFDQHPWPYFDVDADRRKAAGKSP